VTAAEASACGDEPSEEEDNCAKNQCPGNKILLFSYFFCII